MPASRPPHRLLKHVTTVENATDDGALDAFPSTGTKKTDATELTDKIPEDCDCDDLGDLPC